MLRLLNAIVSFSFTFVESEFLLPPLELVRSSCPSSPLCLRETILEFFEVRFYVMYVHLLLWI